MPTAQEMEFKWIREHMMEMSKNVSHSDIDNICKINLTLNKSCRKKGTKIQLKDD